MTSKDLNTVDMDPALRAQVISLKNDYQAFLATHSSSFERIQITPESEPNDTIETANPFTNNDAFNGSISTGATDEDWFSFNVTSTDDLVVFNVTNTSGETATSDSVMEVFDPSGAFAFEDDDGGAAGGESLGAFFANVTGTWSVKLRAFDAASSVDTYDLYALQADVQDSGVSLATGESNDHPFNSVAGETVQVSVFVDSAEAEQDLDIFLLDENDNQLASSETGTINFEFLSFADLPSDGAFTVRITSFESTGPAVNYQISIDVTGAGCDDPEIVFVPPVGQTGLTIQGTPDCEYTVTYTLPDGSTTVFNIIVGADGLGVDNTHPIPADSVIEVNQNGVIGDGSGGVVTVPTLGEWGMIAFVSLLIGTAVVLSRKRRIA
ncbi:IPTL-CTERM sorting domain-containing protein [Sulfidibacter corallicola]|uniref:IPTL-CTERM sorting domain-containing protein n=1 Tax=Sulfidibacter corallicola TaxID=2818388 RepID=A0A8A4TP24_SULCO|nr:IPTL-CTERM sorting domain-containing protein [Sulfidibacter corallicola]QTD51300.1 IPTL-CTERM sorting domain-containing protein [Sulfidibacter corallicola]